MTDTDTFRDEPRGYVSILSEYASHAAAVAMAVAVFVTVMYGTMLLHYYDVLYVASYESAAASQGYDTFKAYLDTVAGPLQAGATAVVWGILTVVFAGYAFE